MVSIRRRKLLALCSGKNSFLTPLPRFFDYANTTPENPTPVTRPVSVHPVPAAEVEQPIEPNDISSASPDSALSKEQPNRAFSDQPIKRRKPHRRKHVHNQEPCLMRGVYFKNMKWQAAIKVDKKQIHLGTVSSQEEAAHLYDRAAFMCGREPNFELPEEVKQQLRKYSWDEFLAITRRGITNKKSKRRLGSGSGSGSGSVKKLDTQMHIENGLSDLDNAMVDSSES